jgi:hypothetical protein
MNQRLRVEVWSDDDFKDLIAEAYIDEDCVMVINQERGFDQLEGGKNRRIACADLLELLQMAKARLWDLRRMPGAEKME